MMNFNLPTLSVLSGMKKSSQFAKRLVFARANGVAPRDHRLSQNCECRNPQECSILHSPNKQTLTTKSQKSNATPASSCCSPDSSRTRLHVNFSSQPYLGLSSCLCALAISPPPPPSPNPAATFLSAPTSHPSQNKHTFDD